jgi:hypothetical protein
MEQLTIYVGDPKTNPTTTMGVNGSPASLYSVLKVCGLKFKEYASMALSNFNSFSADVPAKILYFSTTQVYRKMSRECWAKTERNKFRSSCTSTQPL